MSWNGMDYDDRTDRFNRALCLVEEDVNKAVDLFFAGNDFAHVEYFSLGANRVISVPVIDAITEAIDDGEHVKDLFVRLLRESKDPLVAELKAKFVKGYVERYGEDLAESMVTA